MRNATPMSLAPADRIFRWPASDGASDTEEAASFALHWEIATDGEATLSAISLNASDLLATWVVQANHIHRVAHQIFDACPATVATTQSPGRVPEVRAIPKHQDLRW